MNTAKLSTSNKLVLSKPDGCDRVLVGYYPESNKFFLYLGFGSQESADRCRDYLIEKGLNKVYDYRSDTGCNKPRKAQRVANSNWELKIHRPSAKLVEMMVNREKELNNR